MMNKKHKDVITEALHELEKNGGKVSSALFIDTHFIDLLIHLKMAELRVSIIFFLSIINLFY